MDQKFAVLSRGPNYARENGYNTLYQAREDGALVLAYGYVDLYLSELSVDGGFAAQSRSLSNGFWQSLH
jgi:large conductance mechanosensitive channel